MSELLLRSGAWSSVGPEPAGWRYLSFGVTSEPYAAASGDEELVFVPLRGDCRIRADGEEWTIGGRDSVFDALPSSLYLPRDTEFELRADGPFEVAICGARCERRREPVFVPADAVEIETRGAGNATRQINHIVKPDFPAERILVVEVLTPAGNWSSTPPHKHDEDAPPGEVVLEEVYYYRAARPHGFGLQRLYSPPRDVDETVLVRDGDLMLVPWGYHTFAASPECDLYYLNGLAGDRRSMASADDPAFAWHRQAWTSMEVDARVPLVTRRGRS